MQSDADAIIQVVTYPHPIARVWSALTDTNALARWLMPNDFQPRLGHRFTLTVELQHGWSGTIACEVVALEPPHRLAYTWVSSHPDAPPTLVTFTLESVLDGTRLRLEHSGFAVGGPAGLTIRDILASGWGSKLLRENLPALLDEMAQTQTGKETHE
jgi:uncharacterized protein YndB with AHSA1/START domain